MSGTPGEASFKVVIERLFRYPIHATVAAAARRSSRNALGRVSARSAWTKAEVAFSYASFTRAQLVRAFASRVALVM